MHEATARATSEHPRKQTVSAHNTANKNNVQKIRDRQLASPAQSETLQSLVRAELAEKKHTATEGLVWLNRYVLYASCQTQIDLPSRGLDFTAQSLRHNITHPTEELSASFRHAYGNTLKPHHSFLIKPIFSAALSATPYRKDFYPKMSPDEATRTEKLETWLSALEQRVGILNQFLARKENKY